MNVSDRADKIGHKGLKSDWYKPGKPSLVPPSKISAEVKSALLTQFLLASSLSKRTFSACSTFLVDSKLIKDSSIAVCMAPLIL